MEHFFEKKRGKSKKKRKKVWKTGKFCEREKKKLVFFGNGSTLH